MIPLKLLQIGKLSFKKISDDILLAQFCPHVHTLNVTVIVVYFMHSTGDVRHNTVIRRVQCWLENIYMSTGYEGGRTMIIHHMIMQSSNVLLL